MPRLLRPPINLETKFRVLLRQLGEMWPDDLIASTKKQRILTKTVPCFMALLAEQLGCEPCDLRLDHDPALGAREKVFRHGKHVGYRPSANDPEHLIYRTREDHSRKTNLRGDGAQHPDRVLIAKNRRMERREQEKRGLRKPKRKAKIRSASRWPKGRKINWRAKP